MRSTTPFTAALVLLTIFSLPKQHKLTIWLIGDSTMSVKEKKAWPETGWGMPFVQFWDSTVTVENRALNGRSTRTFMEEKRWQPVVDALKPGDYVFIQFGHNDEVPSKKSYVNEKDFVINLEKYIADSRAKNALPVLITPVARRRFDSSGQIQETHMVYAQLVRDVAASQNVPLIDLAEISKACLQELGVGASMYLFNHLKAGEHPNYPAGKTDDTHFNELGARKMASLVLAQIKTLMPDLSTRIIRK